MIKSPLRYPGGKAKAIPQIVKYLPRSFSEYREPFVGGGSLFIYIRQIFPNINIWINDLNQELFLFWKYAQTESIQLVEDVQRIKDTCTDSRLLFEKLTQLDTETLSGFERAVRFFVLNRITFSGTVESGGFSYEAFQKRFTNSSITRLAQVRDVLQNVRITNFDYREVLQQEGDNVFIFLDPPYFSATKSKLYGKKGSLHTSFDHHRFASVLKNCQHKWLITYDDSPEIRTNFDFANIYAWEMQYGMNNYKQLNAAKGKELFITNYEIERDYEINQSISQQLSLDLSASIH